MAVEQIRGQVGDVRVHGVGGVVDQDVGHAERSLDLIEEGGGRLGPAQVQLHTGDLRALAAQIGEQGFHFLGPAAPGHFGIVGVIPGEEDRGPDGGKAARRGRADADGAAGTGDDCELAGEVEGNHARRSLR